MVFSLYISCPLKCDPGRIVLFLICVIRRQTAEMAIYWLEKSSFCAIPVPAVAGSDMGPSVESNQSADQTWASSSASRGVDDIWRDRRRKLSYKENKTNIYRRNALVK